MAANRVSQEARRERTAQQISAALDTLAVEVEALQSGEDWRRYLNLHARFHAYSLLNKCTLIAIQHAQAFSAGLVDNPDPGYVAGFALWRSLGRRVKRGQHGYVVLAPRRYERKVAIDAEGNSRPLQAGEVTVEGEQVTTRSVVAGFGLARVFSVHQTSGPDLPEPALPQLVTGQAPEGLGAAVLALIEARGFRVDTVPNSGSIGGANGFTNWTSRLVVIRADMSDAGIAKTAIQEAAHVLLHGEPPGQLLPRASKDVEAESVAYSVVATSHGMATDEYSFPYVATWAGPDGVKAVQATQARVAQVAGQIIEASTAAHGGGARPPGSDAIVAQRSGRPARVERLDLDPVESYPLVGL